MTNETGKTQSKQTLGNGRELISKHNPQDPDKPNTKRLRFLALLKSRYGYTNEKAVDELQRLLKQFYRMNRSLGVDRAHPNIKHTHII